VVAFSEKEKRENRWLTVKRCHSRRLLAMRDKVYRRLAVQLAAHQTTHVLTNDAVFTGRLYISVIFVLTYFLVLVLVAVFEKILVLVSF